MLTDLTKAVWNVEIVSVVQNGENFAKLLDKIMRENRGGLARKASESWQVWGKRRIWQKWQACRLRKNIRMIRDHFARTEGLEKLASLAKVTNLNKCRQGCWIQVYNNIIGPQKVDKQG